MSVAAARSSNQIQCSTPRMVKRAQCPVRVFPAKRRRVPDSDMEQLDYTLSVYVTEVGIQRAFDLGDYKQMFKAHGVRGGAL
eukprot:3657677-Heterocapsa_arctica.AAC.1